MDDDLRVEAIGWLSDCGIGASFDGGYHPDDERLVGLINRYYEGGWSAFVLAWNPLAVVS